MDLPSKTDGLTALLGQDIKNLPACQGFYHPTADFVSDIIEDLPEQASLQDIEEVKNLLMETYKTREGGELVRDYILTRAAQAEKLKKFGSDVLMDMISMGMLPSRLCKTLGVSYATLDLFLQKRCDPIDLDHALTLAADMLIEEGRAELEACDEGSKLGIMKATEIAKNNLMIAKSLSSKYAEKRAADIQVNTQINNVGDGEKKESWLRMWEPELKDLEPLPELKPIRAVENDELNNADIDDGEWSLD